MTTFKTSVHSENVNLLFNILSTAATSSLGNSFLSRARKKEEPGNQLESNRPANSNISSYTQTNSGSIWRKPNMEEQQENYLRGQESQE